MDDKKQCHQLIPECASLLCDLIIGANFPNPSQSMMDTVRTLPISQISHCGCSSGSGSQILSLMSLISDLTTPAAPRPWLSLQTNIFKTKLQFKMFSACTLKQHQSVFIINLSLLHTNHFKRSQFVSSSECANIVFLKNFIPCNFP